MAFTVYLHGKSDIKQWASKQASEVLSISTTWHPRAWSKTMGIAIVLPRLQKKKKKPVDFDDELKTGNVRYDNLT